MRYLFGICAVLFMTACPAWGEERIVDFSSSISVESDGSLLVTETITVQAEGGQIKRGIVREFPTRYDTPSGAVRVGFELLDVERDGRSEPYHTEKRSNGVAIYAGSKDVFLPPGRYAYTLTYRTTRQLGFFADHDELYWNVTGNGWRLPVDRVECEVQLPRGATVTEAVAYEGSQGSAARRRLASGGNSLVLTSSRAYAPGEGLTIAVSWPKGFVTESSSTGRSLDFVALGGSLGPVAVGAALLLVYYLMAWLKVGRDPAKGVIIPRFAPPKGFSPAMLRTLWRMKFDNAAFTAGIVNMAVKGALKIVDNGDTALDLAPNAPAGLALGERAAWTELRKAGARLELKNTNHRLVGRARQAMQDALHTELASRYFATNSGWVAPGIVLTLAAMGLLAWGAPDPMSILFMAAWLTFWTFGCSLLVRQVWRAWQARGVMGKLGALFQSAFALPFVGGEIMGLFFLASEAGLAATAIFLGMVAMNAVFYELLKAPTVIGRQVLDEIEGFRLYLSVAEEDRLNFVHPPDETPELFEKFLPYALALGVENEWGERFSGLLNQAGYEPGWYSGHQWSPAHPAGFASGLGGGLGSAISSAATAPGRSSGMSGGSSGGGGGGGGGGGW